MNAAIAASVPRHDQSFMPSGAVKCYVAVRLVASFEPPSISGHVPVPAFGFRQLREPGPSLSAPSPAATRCSPMTSRRHDEARALNSFNRAAAFHITSV
jgi:hypothetical protein